MTIHIQEGGIEMVAIHLSTGSSHTLILSQQLFYKQYCLHQTITDITPFTCNNLSCTFVLYISIYLCHSDGKENRPADNVVNITIPVRYDSELILTK